MQNIISITSSKTNGIIGIYDLNQFCAFRVIVDKENKHKYQVIGNTKEGNEIIFVQSEDSDLISQLMELIEKRSKQGAPTSNEQRRTE